MHKESFQLKVPFTLQEEWYWCGPMCLSLVARYWGKQILASTFARSAGTNEHVGTSCAAMSHAARAEGFWVYESMRGSPETLRRLLADGVPAIVYVYHEEAPNHGHGELDHYHFEIVTGYTDTAFVCHDVDPAVDGGSENEHVSLEDFKKIWHSEPGADGRWLLALSPRQADERFVPPYFTGEPHAS